MDISQPEQKTIVIAEDEDPLRKLLAIFFRRQAYLVLEARDGIEALEQFQGHSGQVDLLVTDLRMPRMNGIDLIKKTKLLYPGTRILIISGSLSDFAEDLKEIAQPVFAVSKPFDRAGLLAKVRDILGSAGGAGQSPAAGGAA